MNESVVEMIKKYNLIAVLILVTILFINNNSQIVQGIILSMFSSMIIIHFIATKKINLYLALMLTILILGILLLLFKKDEVNFFYFISEIKIIILFTLPFYFNFLFRHNDAEKILNSFYRIFSISIFLTLMYGLIIYGATRYTGFFPHSIYVAVIISILTSVLFKVSKKKWLILNIFNVILLGSSSGSILFLIAIILNLKVSIWKKIIPSFFALIFGYWFIVYFRGREILNGGFWAIDRVQIFMSTLSHAIENFTFSEWIFGYGLGRELYNFSFINSYNTVVDYGFVNWFNFFTLNGVYSFALHNEYWRLIYDYGLLGLIIVFLFLYKSIDKMTFSILCIGCITNTIVFSTLGLIVLSMIISYEQNKIKIATS